MPNRATGLALVLLVSAIAGCVGTRPDGAEPSLHPTLDDALAHGFQQLVGRAPFVVRLWLEHAEGLTARWDIEGNGVVVPSGAQPGLVRFDRPGVYEPSVTLAGFGRPTVTLRQRIVVLGDAPAAAAPGRFGVNEDVASDPPAQVTAQLGLMRAAGVDWLRLPLRWFWLEPQRDHYRWDRVDGVVGQARAAGLELLAVLGGTPRWASGVTARSGVPPDAFPPADTRDFAEYVYRSVDRFKGLIQTYELMNEPNSPEHWAPQPNADRFLELLCAGYLAAKYADPDSTVVAGGLNGNGLFLGYEPPESRDFLKALYADPASRCFDVVAIHPFAHPVSDGPQVLQAWVDEARAYMAAQGDRRPLWITETGWSTGTALWGHPTISEAQQAEWVRTVFTDIAGPQKIFWYNFKENRANPTDPEYQWGWVRYDLEPKAAYRAFAGLTK